MADGKVLAVVSHPVKDFAAWKSSLTTPNPFGRELALQVQVFQDPTAQAAVGYFGRRNLTISSPWQAAEAPARPLTALFANWIGQDDLKHGSGTGI